MIHSESVPGIPAQVTATTLIAELPQVNELDGPELTALGGGGPPWTGMSRQMRGHRAIWGDRAYPLPQRPLHGGPGGQTLQPGHPERFMSG